MTGLRSTARGVPHSSHWGAFSVLRPRSAASRSFRIRATADPSALLGNIPAVGVAPGADRPADGPARLAGAWAGARSAAGPRRIRAGLVARSARPRRGELRRVYATHGPRAIFGGSYGWASAGRFHDAQHQIHRFLNLAGGYVRSVNSYSSGAASGDPAACHRPARCGRRQQCQLGRAGGRKRAGAGLWRHGAQKQRCRRRRHEPAHRPRAICARRASAGVEFHLIGPLRDDLPAEIEAVWHPIRPGTDVALMLGLAHTLVTEGRHDRAFLDRFCVGWEAFEAYLLGRRDGQPKDAVWAAAICGLPADEIIAPRAACGRAAHPGHLLAVPAARRAWRAAGVDGRGAGRNARPDRAAGRRLCLCAGLDLEYRQAAAGGAAADPAARPQQHRRFHPGGAHRRHAAASGRAVRLRRPAADLSRHQAGLLGRRQSVPPPSGSEPAAPRFRPPGYGDRAGFGMDGERAPRRHRVAGDDHPGARGYRRRGRRPATGGDASGGRALSRGARRLRHLRRSRRAARLCRDVHRGPFGPRIGSNTSTSRPAARWRSAASTRPISPNSGKTGELVLPTLPWDGGIVRAFRRDPDAAPLPTPSGKIEITSATIAGFRLCRLPGTSDLAAAGRWRRITRRGALPAAARRQPAGDPVAQPARFRRHQPGLEDQGARAGPHPSAGCRGARHHATATSCASTTSAAPASPARC